MERKFKVTENGGVELVSDIQDVVKKQKNYVIREENIELVKAWSKQFGMKSDSEMLDEIILAFADMLELGKKSKEQSNEDEIAITKEEVKKPATNRAKNTKPTKPATTKEADKN